MDGDGTPDDRDPDVASLPNAEDGSYVSLVTNDGMLANVVSDPGVGPSFPVGVFEFVIEGLTPGASVRVQIHRRGSVTS